MSNKTFIPAFQCQVGDWKYYICMMKYGEVARQVNFAYELGGNAELGALIQRGISARTKGITEYLLKSDHRFLGALVVAAWGGEPSYTPLSMDDPDGMLRGLDREFGVLTFDGTQQYFVLDGQHRLRAIKDAMKKNPSIGSEDICVIFVTHYDTEKGRERTRRLFSNINRNAKQTAVSENIALDEDDGFAILTRRVLTEHPFLREEGRVRVILSIGEEGEVKLASANVPKTDSKALTAFTVLYDLLRYLGWDLPGSMWTHATRPPDEALEKSYEILVERLDDLLKCCGGLRARLEAVASAREVRAPKGAEGDGHPFMRPVVQKAVARVVAEIRKQGLLEWPEVMRRLSELEWKLSAAPWVAVFNVEGGKMIAGKDHSDLLCGLLHAHIAPTSQQGIKRVRKEFKELRSFTYPISEEDLVKRVPKGEGPPPAAVLAEPPNWKELSENPEFVALPSEPEPVAAADEGASIVEEPSTTAE